jgi:predicted ferric reductase
VAYHIVYAHHIVPIARGHLFVSWALHKNGTIYEIGKNFGLTAFMILMFQPLLAGRFKWIEAPFGMDILVRFHKYMAIFALCLLVLHPVLLAGGGIGWKLLIGIDLPWYIWVGKVTLVLLLVNVVLSLFQKPLGIKFEKWRCCHDILAPSIFVLAFFHSWFAGQDLRNPPLECLWPVIVIIALSLLFLPSDHPSCQSGLQAIPGFKSKAGDRRCLDNNPGTTCRNKKSL